MNHKPKLAVILLGLMQLFSLGSARAALVRFAAPTPYTGSSISSDEFVFSATGFQSVLGSGALNSGASNGTSFLTYFAGTSGTVPGTETITVQGNSPFNLTSLDLGGGLNYYSDTSTLTITGYQVGGTTVTAKVSVAVNSFNTYSLNGFTDLQSVTLGSLYVSDTSAYVNVDNIVATPIPEPATYALMLGGLGLMGATRRRSTSQDSSQHGFIPRTVI